MDRNVDWLRQISLFLVPSCREIAYFLNGRSFKLFPIIKNLACDVTCILYLPIWVHNMALGNGLQGGPFVFSFTRKPLNKTLAEMIYDWVLCFEGNGKDCKTKRSKWPVPLFLCQDKQVVVYQRYVYTC